MTQQQAPAKPMTDDDQEGWRNYWSDLGQPWRTEPEISRQRQRILTARRNTPPKDAFYTFPAEFPFSGFRLTRADLEWLLATHGGGQGPVRYREKDWYQRRGIDVRGADLRQVNLRGLPLTCLVGGYEAPDDLAPGPWARKANGYLEAASVHLEGADLTSAELQGAHLAGAHLEGAYMDRSAMYFVDLRGAFLAGTQLRQAQLSFGVLWYAQCIGTNLSHAFLEKSSLIAAHLHGVCFDESHLVGSALRLCCFSGCTFRKAHVEGADARCAQFIGCAFSEAHLEWSRLEYIQLVGCTFQGTYLSGASLQGMYAIHPHPLQGAILQESSVPARDLTRIRLWVKEYPSLLTPARTDGPRVGDDSQTEEEEERPETPESGAFPPDSVNTPLQNYNSLVVQGREAMEAKNYWMAREHFQKAIQCDPCDPLNIRVVGALAAIFQNTLTVAMDHLERHLSSQPEDVLALLFYLWCQMCQKATQEDFLEQERSLAGMPRREDVESLLLELATFPFDGQEGRLYCAIIAYLRGDYPHCLDQLTPLIRKWQGPYPWAVTFWKTMADAALEQDEQAKIDLQETLNQGIPPLLLLPLRWFKQSRPYFFDDYIRSQFLELRLPHRETWGQKERRKSTKAKSKQKGTTQ